MEHSTGPRIVESSKPSALARSAKRAIERAPGDARPLVALLRVLEADLAPGDELEARRMAEQLFSPKPPLPRMHGRPPRLPWQRPDETYNEMVRECMRQFRREGLSVRKAIAQTAATMRIYDLRPGKQQPRRGVVYPLLADEPIPGLRPREFDEDEIAEAMKVPANVRRHESAHGRSKRRKITSMAELYRLAEIASWRVAITKAYLEAADSDSLNPCATLSFGSTPTGPPTPKSGRLNTPSRKSISGRLRSMTSCAQLPPWRARGWRSASGTSRRFLVTPSKCTVC
jgi:hypothetical protein